jgi:O-antigen/teichoic acid export membrane protein
MELKALLFENISAKQIVLKNSFWLYFANVIVKLFKFFLVVYAARILGPAQYGTFNYVLYLTGLFFIFSDLGIGSFLVREYQKREIDKNKIIPVGFLLKLISTIIPLLIAFFVYFYTEDLLVKSIFFVLLVMVIINNWRDFFASLSQANNRLEYNSGALII